MPTPATSATATHDTRRAPPTAQLHGRTDDISGVSECIIMGAPMPVGTGAFELVHDPSQCDSVRVQLPPRKVPLLEQLERERAAAREAKDSA